MKIFLQALMLLAVLTCATGVTPAPTFGPEQHSDVIIGAKPDPDNPDAFRPMYEIPPRGAMFCRRPGWDFQCAVPYGYGTRVKFGWGHDPVRHCVLKVWNTGSIMANVWHVEPDGASGAGCAVKKIGVNRFQIFRSDK